MEGILECLAAAWHFPSVRMDSANSQGVFCGGKERARESNTEGVNKNGAVAIRTDVDTWSRGSSTAGASLKRSTKLASRFDAGSKCGQLLDNMQEVQAGLLLESLGADRISQKRG